MVADDSLMTTEVEGRRLAWRATGEGRPLLLVNGYAATGADWDPTFLGLLAERHRVICPDNRGIGGSELGDGELTVGDMAADLEALMDALEIERAPIVAEGRAAMAPATLRAQEEAIAAWHRGWGR